MGGEICVRGRCVRVCVYACMYVWEDLGLTVVCARTVGD